MTLYQHRNIFKYVIFVCAFIIGLISLYYTNSLVKKLVKREKDQIELYAAALRYTLDPANNHLSFIYREIIVSNTSIPVISTDVDGNIIIDKNINYDKKDTEEEKQRILERELEEMKKENPPIVMEFPGNKERRNYIYYRNSYLIYQLRYYPYAQLTVIAIFGFLTYMAFNYSRRMEQNRVWVGLAKETAHQLGTPISSLMAWVEYLQNDPSFAHNEILPELDKDVRRLEMITARFSNIGSKPTLKLQKLSDVIQEIIEYLRPRISTKVSIDTINFLPKDTEAMINRHLFEWVIENICKNAVDAMDGVGKIEITLKIKHNQNKIVIDIADTGKGIPKGKVSKVFDPGFTTKKRGWGLGLTLAKRIIEEYHKGKITVKNSEIGRGTMFRIVLNQSLPQSKKEVLKKINPFVED